MIIGIPKETAPGETRVAGVPETAGRMVREGLEVLVETGAGKQAGFSDEQYAKAGAKIASNAGNVYSSADVIVKINPPRAQEVDLLKRGSVLVCILEAKSQPQRLSPLAKAGVTSFALDNVPRISRAQSMDVLSSMASLAGYKAVLLAANELTRLMPMMMTAAGTIKPVRALVIGAGVAGLQAIATLRRLGAAISAADVRPAVEEEVASLGAKFVPMKVEHAEAQTSGGYAADLGEDFYRQEQDILRPHVEKAGVVITTALVPGRRAPILITDSMLEAMGDGSVIVDLAAAAGGNCTRTKPDERVQYAGAVILGPTNLPAAMATDASVMFARNVARFIQELAPGGKLNMDMGNEVLSSMLATHEGRVVFGGKKPGADEPAASPETATAPEQAPPEQAPEQAPPEQGPEEQAGKPAHEEKPTEEPPEQAFDEKEGSGI